MVGRCATGHERQSCPWPRWCRPGAASSRVGGCWQMAAEGSSATWRAEASNHGEAAEDCDKAYSQSLIILSCMLDYRLGNKHRKNAMLALDILCVLEHSNLLEA